MNHESLPPDPRMLAHLEQLACGDLPESARGPLLEWLEADASRWRLFGLAALEAQTLSQALDGFGQADCFRRAQLISAVDEVEQRGAANPCKRTPDGARLTQPWRPESQPRSAPTPARPAYRRPAYAGVLAASVVAAFALGFSARGGGPSNSGADNVAGAARGELPQGGDRPHTERGRPMLASLKVNAGLSAGTVQLPVRPAKSDAPPADAGIADYVRAKWRRQGYDVNVERRYLFANLADGTPIVVPIDQVSLQRVAVPVH